MTPSACATNFKEIIFIYARDAKYDFITQN